MSQDTLIGFIAGWWLMWLMWVGSMFIGSIEL